MRGGKVMIEQNITSITQTVAAIIDYWWAWLVPVIIMFVLRKYIANIWFRIIMKLSDAPYTNVGNVVQFQENGTKWKIVKITKHSVYLENYEKEKNGNLELLRMPIDMYYNSKIIYSKV
jgi:hypothetical protein